MSACGLRNSFPNSDKSFILARHFASALGSRVSNSPSHSSTGVPLFGTRNILMAVWGIPPHPVLYRQKWALVNRRIAKMRYACEPRIHRLSPFVVGGFDQKSAEPAKEKTLPRP